MDSDDLRQILAFEESLKPGDPVHALWTNSNNYYAAEAEVVRVNRVSIRIRLVEGKRVPGRAPMPPVGYAVGQEFPVPRCNTARWSESNRVAPLATTSAGSGALLDLYVEVLNAFGYHSQEAIEAFKRWSLATFDREVTDRASYTPRGDVADHLTLDQIYPRPAAVGKCHNHWHCDPARAAHVCDTPNRSAPCPTCGALPAGVHTLWIRLDLEGDINDAHYVLNELLDGGIVQANIDDHEFDAGPLAVINASVEAAPSTPLQTCGRCGETFTGEDCPSASCEGR